MPKRSWVALLLVTFLFVDLTDAWITFVYFTDAPDGTPYFTPARAVRTRPTTAKVTKVTSAKVTTPKAKVTPKAQLECDPAITVANGRVASGRSTVGSSRKISCETGFKIVGNNFVICQQGGSWSKPGDCVGILCPQPTIEHGSFSDGFLEVGSTRQLSCDPGYSFTGNGNTIECLSSGKWWEPFGKCEPLAASTPTTATTGAVWSSNNPPQGNNNYDNYDETTVDPIPAAGVDANLAPNNMGRGNTNEDEEE